jgi:molybdopterin synthase catalytic subunit
MNGVAGVALVEITEAPIDLTALVAHVQHDGVGAVATFLGTVRDVNDGRTVTGIDYEAYQPMAEREMRAIASEMCAQWEGLRMAIVHRVGTLHIGDVSVAIACAHARRAPAADAMRAAIEALKVRVPIWKREHYADGDWTWVDPTVSALPTVAS